ncbi:asparagine synthase (glutamine-hydrolyzing) [Paramagnetospirillum magneticum]|uniref:asparagine synthase (glutamine-hydrolyzing) n=1 Tax=Paramagnetospirillum magneticum (strain ATCC 700264 / AMB-1) TaxID=342108 RepID=Q2WBC9_PARM1|nr:asparagine synthase (glutamine-hydrolyzing) [Paramagnetospirillum magneticum]BAE48846.1 Asparagine synthase [Paramagnetospirillum magneticum AMB-1]
MCGLAAIFAYQSKAPPVQGDELAVVRDAMRLRGPDGAASWISPDGRVGLAHRRLAIIDLSPAGAQPMTSADGRLALVFNGEIYNYRALRAELESLGTVFRSHTDTEVILEGWRHWGRDVLSRLRGMFALALWDNEARGMLLARDPLGIKPLYMADQGGCLRVASQVKALLAGGSVDTTPDPAGHAGFFLWGHVPEPHTLYRAIQALPAGSWLWRDEAGGRDEGRFFDLGQELAAADEKSFDIDILHEALADSVKAHLEADVPVGLFLSGGLDSTTLAALVREAAEGPVKSITLGFSEFQGGAQDEVPLAERVAAHYRLNHTTSRVTAADFAQARDQLLAHMDQPSVDGVNTWFVARAAARSGLKVALSGLGGDELFAGYDSFAQIPRLAGALGPLRPLRGLGTLLRMALSPWIGRFASPKTAGLLEWGTSFGDAYLLRRALFMPWELPRVMDSDMAREGWKALQAPSRLEAATAGISSARLKVSALEAGFYMRNQLLRDSDWAGMAHSLEIRVPLVDVDLLRAVLPLVRGPRPPGKRDMAACARPALPPELLDRPKTGFFVPVAQWLGASSLRGWARQVHGAFQA